MGGWDSWRDVEEIQQAGPGDCLRRGPRSRPTPGFLAGARRQATAPLPRETAQEWLRDVLRSVELGVHVGRLSAASCRQLEGESLREQVRAGSPIRSRPRAGAGAVEEAEPVKERWRPENEEVLGGPSAPCGSHRLGGSSDSPGVQTVF